MLGNGRNWWECAQLVQPSTAPFQWTYKRMRVMYILSSLTFIKRIQKFRFYVKILFIQKTDWVVQNIYRGLEIRFVLSSHLFVRWFSGFIQTSLFHDGHEWLNPFYLSSRMMLEELFRKCWTKMDRLGLKNKECPFSWPCVDISQRLQQEMMCIN